MLSRLTSRAVRLPSGYSRAASTSTRGLQAILQKNPDDVVVTFAQRTAMGRARKGQLKDTPVDELLHALFKVRNCAGSSMFAFRLCVCTGNLGEDST